MNIAVLRRYHPLIASMWTAGVSAEQIAIHLYENALGPVDPRYRAIDVRFLTGLVDRYLNNFASDEAEQKAREQRQQEVSARREQVRLERQAKAAIRKQERAQREQELAEVERQLAAERQARQACFARRKQVRLEQQAEVERRLAAEKQARRARWLAKGAGTMPWRDRSWEALLPPTLAVQQASWCRHMAALRMRQAGLSLDQIAYRLGMISRGRAHQIVQHAERLERRKPSNKSPLEHWLQQAESFKASYVDPQGLLPARRALEVVEVWTGRATVPRCPESERRIWELYYKLREQA